MNRREFENILNRCRGANDDIALINRMTKKVASSGNPYFICDFAEHVQAADTPENMEILQNAIIDTNDIVHIYEFAFCMTDSNINNFNLKKCELEIIKSKNPKLMYYFIGYIPGTNIPNMLESLYMTKNNKYINLALEHLKELGWTDINTSSLTSKSETEIFYPECLKSFDTKDLEQLQVNVIASKNPYYINELAENIQGVNTTLLQKAMLKTKDILHIYEYMCSVPNADLELIQRTIINSKMAKYMFYFLKYVEGANKEMLEAAIKSTGNEKYIAKIS